MKPDQERARRVPPAEKMKLWKRAMGACSYPSCRTDLVYRSQEPLFGGEAAHIAGESKSGPRGMDPLPMERRHLYENLILLCPSHHNEIDVLEAEYPSEVLRQMKMNHERRMDALRRLGGPWRQRYIAVDYLNLPRLLLFDSANFVLDELARYGLAEIKTLRRLGIQRLRVLHASEKVLEEWHDHAIPLAEMNLANIAPGAVLSFTDRFSIKNIPGPEEDPPLTGNFSRDPHVWLRLGERRLIIRLDPAWITTSTAFSSGAQGVFSGLAIVVDSSQGAVVASGIVLGQPMTPVFDAVFNNKGRRTIDL